MLALIPRHIKSISIYTFAFTVSPIFATGTTPCSITTTIDFNNIPGGFYNIETDSFTPIDVIANAALTRPIGETKGVQFEHAGLSNNDLTGIRAHSPPNSIAGRNVTVMRVDYPNPLFKQFQLFNFWFGCNIALRNAVVKVPLSCTVTIKGYSYEENKPTVTQAFNYTAPPLAPAADMVEAKVDSERFKNLKRVEFSAVPKGDLLLDQILILKMDDPKLRLELVQGP